MSNNDTSKNCKGEQRRKGQTFMSKYSAGPPHSSRASFRVCQLSCTRIRLPGVNGLEFQGVLARAGIHIPIVFMTGHGDIPMSVKAMKAGAIDFLPMISMT
jgi:DNA-binding NtrC family response regulator